jgi:predicted DNA-binding transcriptional regulator YafY
MYKQTNPSYLRYENVERAFKIYRYLCTSGRPVSKAELATRYGVNLWTIGRLLKVIERVFPELEVTRSEGSAGYFLYRITRKP